MNSSDVFPILSRIFFSVRAVEKEKKFLLSPKIGFFLSFPIEKEIVTIIRTFVIRNRGTYLMSQSVGHKWQKLNLGRYLLFADLSGDRIKFCVVIGDHRQDSRKFVVDEIVIILTIVE